MVDIKSIAIVVLIIVVLLIILKFVTFKSGLTDLTDAETSQSISASYLTSGDAGSVNFGYSIWMYVDDWNYRYGKAKVVLGRLDGDKRPCPSIVLAPTQNNLSVSMSVYPSKNSTEEVTHSCNVYNVPIQTWVNVTVSVYNKTLDVYLDGKLVRTCLLPGVPKIDGNAPVFVTPNGGFSGYTAKLQYWDKSLDPQTVWNVYKKGWSNNFLKTLSQKYQVKLSVLDNGDEQGSLTV